MKKLNLLKTLILVISVLISTGKAFCEATAVQSVYTIVQPTVAVEKISSNESGSINPESGIASDLSSSFNLKSNDGQTFFVVYSTITTFDGSVVSAFDGKNNLLFANKEIPPTVDAVNRAKQGLKGNMNVIGYRMSLTGDDFNILFTESTLYEDCYKISLKDTYTNGTLLQTVGGSPAVNTYGNGEDMSGNYVVTVYVTSATKI